MTPACVPRARLWQDGAWHFRVNSADKLNYWRKSFELVLAIAASRVRLKRSLTAPALPSLSPPSRVCVSACGCL